MKNFLLLSTVFLVFSFPAFADDEGNHHEDLSADQLGTVHFPVSCAPSVQKPFERGVALLHSFWYEEAQKEFADVAKSDPQCAMAHWGLAMSNWHQLWDHPNDASIAKGLAEVNQAKALHPKAGREADYIAAMGVFYSGKDREYQDRAVAYSKAMEKIYVAYPEDREGAAFYALSLLASEPDHDTTFANRKQAAAVLEKLFTLEPNHPGVAHYLIHSYDKPQLAELGLPAARRYAQIAPSAPHALHMPSHIFARLGLWQDDISSNLASIAATRKTAAMHMGGEGHQFHAMDFLDYAYLQSGHEAEAQRLIDEAKAIPAMKDMYGMGFDPRIDFIVTASARQALELHHWAEAAALPLVPGAEPADNSMTYGTRAIGAARGGQLADARKDLAEIEKIKQIVTEQKKTDSIDAVEHERSIAAAWISYADGREDEGIQALRRLADQEDAEGDEPWRVPAREMLADMLLDRKRPEQALTEYETDLKFNANRFNGLYGAAQAAEMAGMSAKSTTYYASLVKSCAGSNSDRPELRQAKQLLAKK
jgi:hypothetical protein